MFILKHTKGLSAEYIEAKPVSFRKNLVRDILKELDDKSDGSSQLRQKPKAGPKK